MRKTIAIMNLERLLVPVVLWVLIDGFKLQHKEYSPRMYNLYQDKNPHCLLMKRDLIEEPQ